VSTVSAAVVLEAGAVLARAEADLCSVTDTPRLEAELLLAEATGLTRVALMARPTRPIGGAEALRFEALVARRRRGEPFAYIVGYREFYSLRLAVGPAVLVPRPETETLVDAALARLVRANASVLDLGTGSGAIALALKHERGDLPITAVDCDDAALAVARSNAAAHALDIRWLKSNWYSAVAGRRFDLIAANPPYVASGDAHFGLSLGHEPRLALDGGADGLDAYRAIFRDACSFLVPEGWLLVEHGFDQREAVIELAAAANLRLDGALDDLAGLPRVACFRPVTA
jgi:release factor glutamine methyltransferase